MTDIKKMEARKESVWIEFEKDWEEFQGCILLYFILIFFDDIFDDLIIGRTNLHLHQDHEWQPIRS